MKEENSSYAPRGGNISAQFKFKAKYKNLEIVTFYMVKLYVMF